MKFSTRKDIEAPADYVFERISDFDALERQAMRRGIEVARKDQDAIRGNGAAWTMKIPFRGKQRELDATVTEFDAPNAVRVSAVSGGLDMELENELVALNPNRTRLVMKLDVRPKTLSARILVQSVKFAKSTLDRRFDRRVGRICDVIGEDFAKSK